MLLDSFVIPIYLLAFMALELFGLFYIYGINITVLNYSMEIKLFNFLQNSNIVRKICYTSLFQYMNYMNYIVLGFKYMKHDLEFILNHKINYFLIFLWMIMPIALSGMICWQIWKHFNDWSGSTWTFWLMIGMFIFSLLNIVIWAVWVIAHKEGYGIMQVNIKYVSDH